MVAYGLGRGLAAFLSIDRLTGFFRVFIHGLLNVTGLIELLRQRIEHGLRRRRRFLRASNLPMNITDSAIVEHLT